MKNILLENDGSINEEGIDEYIKVYGINTPYNSDNSLYNNQTLLSAAVSSNEINSDTKLKLISYLISNGAEINHPHTTKNGGLVAIALSQKHYELADLLVKFGANLQDTYQTKNLMNIALDLKDEQMLLWILKNAKPFFFELKKEYSRETNEYLHDLSKYHKKISDIFPNYEKSELYQYVKEMEEERIHYKFKRLGLINTNDVALILAAKMSKKPYENSIFVITDDDIPEIIESIKNFIENDTTKNVIKFQIVHFPGLHAVFGEFEINKTTNPPTVTYLHCDPNPPTTEYNEIITPDFRKQISSLANIEICDSNVMIIKGLGCPYFSIDGAMMLAMPQDRYYVPNLTQYMKEHGQEKSNLFDEKNIKYVKSFRLPTRFIRGMHFIDDGTDASSYIKGLNSLVLFNATEKNTIVNKRKETAEVAIRRDLRARNPKADPNKTVTYNIRFERKMNQYGQVVRDFIKDKNVLDPEFSKLLDQYKIKGLVQFVEEKFEKKPGQKIKT